MKRCISILLALALLLPGSLIAYAAEAPMEPGKPAAVTLNKGQSKTLTFTPGETAIYHCEITFVSAAVIRAVGRIGTFEFLNMTFLTGETEEYTTDLCYFKAKKGQTVTFRLEEISEDDEPELQIDFPSKLTLNLKKADLKEIAYGNTYTVRSQKETYAFIPEEDGCFNFRSRAADGADPCITMTGVNDYLFHYQNDTKPEEDVNFDLSGWFKKGIVYLIEVENLSQKGSFSFTVGDAKAIRVETIAPDYKNITVYKSDYAFAYIDAYPTGAILDADTLEISYSKPGIAEFTDLYEFSGTNSVYGIVRGLKTGKTTVTVTDANGASCRFTVRVLPKFLQGLEDAAFFIRYLPLLIVISVSDWFQTLFGR